MRNEKWVFFVDGYFGIECTKIDRGSPAVSELTSEAYRSISTSVIEGAVPSVYRQQDVSMMSGPARATQVEHRLFLPNSEAVWRWIAEVIPDVEERKIMIGAVIEAQTKRLVAMSLLDLVRAPPMAVPRVQLGAGVLGMLHRQCIYTMRQLLETQESELIKPLSLSELQNLKEFLAQYGLGLKQG